MAHYRGTVQRLLHRAPPGSTFLAKNVSSYGRIASLLEAFPDARLIHIARHRANARTHVERASDGSPPHPARARAAARTSSRAI
ncbi:MAG: sulfotransferase, partial [Myxococcales bacterium]|nr:sulfotransferase [Myxococcales bacterium]